MIAEKQSDILPKLATVMATWKSTKGRTEAIVPMTFSQEWSTQTELNTISIDVKIRIFNEQGGFPRAGERCLHGESDCPV